MKKNMLMLSVLVLSLLIALVAFAALKGNKIELKVGDEVYACGCGAGCDCDTLSRQAGKCSCGKDLVKAKVTKVEAGKAYVKPMPGPKRGHSRQKGNMSAHADRVAIATRSARNPASAVADPT